MEESDALPSHGRKIICFCHKFMIIMENFLALAAATAKNWDIFYVFPEIADPLLLVGQDQSNPAVRDVNSHRRRDPKHHPSQSPLPPRNAEFLEKLMICQKITTKLKIRFKKKKYSKVFFRVPDPVFLYSRIRIMQRWKKRGNFFNDFQYYFLPK